MLVGCVSVPTLVQGQSNSARPHVIVAGVVADGSGGVLPGANVEVLAAGQVVSRATTGPDGRYRIRLAPDGLYQLRVRWAGFTDHVVELPVTSVDVTCDVVMGMAAVADLVVVTPSRFLESRAATTESITVLTARDIEALGSQSLADVVRTVPGLHVESTGREGSLASLFSRGGESDYNLVLVDGVRVNASGGQFDFSRISASEIDRVEIVRGAQSALYGSDAIGSVIQVFTRRAGALDSPTLSGSVEAGSFNTWRTDLRLLGGAHERADYHVDASYRGSDGAFSSILPESDRSIRRRSTEAWGSSWASPRRCGWDSAIATPGAGPLGRSRTERAIPARRPTAWTCRGMSTSRSVSPRGCITRRRLPISGRIASPQTTSWIPPTTSLPSSRVDRAHCTRRVRALFARSIRQPSTAPGRDSAARCGSVSREHAVRGE